MGSTLISSTKTCDTLKTANKWPDIDIHIRLNAGMDARKLRGCQVYYMNDKDTGWGSPQHQFNHIKSHPSGVQEYECTICGAVVILDWSDISRYMFLNRGDLDKHPANELLLDWVDGIDLNKD